MKENNLKVAQKLAVRYALIYLSLAFLWISGFHYLRHILVWEMDPRHHVKLLENIVFVVTTATLFFIFTRHLVGSLIQAKEHEKQLALLPDADPQPLIDVSDQGDIMYANPAALREFPDLRNKESGHFLAQEVLSGIEKMKKTGESFALTEVRSSKGAYSGTIYRIPESRLLRLYLSPLKRDAEEMDWHFKLAFAVEQAAESIVITDPDGTIRYVNHMFEVMTGYSRDEVLGKNPRFLKSGKHDAQFYGEFWSTLLKKEVWRGRMVNRRKDGTQYEELATVSPVIGKNGNVISYVAMKADISKETEIEEKLRQFQKLEEVGRLAGGIAHDFNNLLAVILNYSAFIVESAPPGEIKEDAEEIRKAAERAAALTQQLLIFSRRDIVKYEVVNVNKVVENIGKLLERTIGEDIHLELVFADDLSEVRIDSKQFEQIIMNLAVNARDAMPSGGTLRIVTNNVVIDEIYASSHVGVAPGSYACVLVSDNGVGMTRAVTARVFEPFFTTKDPGKGTGLGLSMVYAIVKRAGGNVWVYSEPGIGTTFRIYLPFAQEGLTVAKPGLGMSALDGADRVVLLVEDEPAIRMVVARILRRKGFEVKEAANGKEALDIFAQGTQFHLVITDMVMPGISGHELAAKIHETNVDLPVLFMSGFSQETIARRGVLPEHLDLLQKPFTEQDLFHRMENIFSGKN